MKEIQIINFNDKNYPENLKKIKDPPYRLYAIGNIDLLHKKSLAIVGTRHITDYGIKNCKNFAQKIVQMDIPIISGMAIGTDTVAHETALKYGGETIAVLGCGFKNIFPKENIRLFEEIVEMKGLVISEYSPEVKAKSERFLKRNRIVSGLSEGVLVIEAGYRSGTSVTAKLAYSQGKIVMALPGRLDSKYGVGVNKLIQEGAKLITEIDDIKKCFPQFENKKWKTDCQQKIFQIRIKEEYKEIVEILKNGQKTIEEIVLASKDKDLRQTMNLLINMELDEIIVQKIGEGYRLNEEG